MTSRIELNPLVEMGEEQIETLYGSATLSPSGAVTAGSWGTWRLRYTAGSYGIDENGTLLVAWRFATDWGTPQPSEASAPNHVSATTDSRSCKVACRYDPKGYVRPWRACLAIDIFDGPLLPGETIVITYGDRSGASPGTRAQTFVENTGVSAFPMLWDESFDSWAQLGVATQPAWVLFSPGGATSTNSRSTGLPSGAS